MKKIYELLCVLHTGDINYNKLRKYTRHFIWRIILMALSGITVISLPLGILWLFALLKIPFVMLVAAVIAFIGILGIWIEKEGFVRKLFTKKNFMFCLGSLILGSLVFYISSGGKTYSGPIGNLLFEPRETEIQYNCVACGMG